MTQQYWELPGFEAVYLENSFVLDVVARPGIVALDIELVLTERHPEYKVPPAAERHSYRLGQILFEQVTRLHWLSSGFRPATDASGQSDYGGIDQFIVEGQTHTLQGDFGELVIEASHCRVALTSLI